MKNTIKGETLQQIATMRGVSYQAVSHFRDHHNIKPVGKRGNAALYDPKAFKPKDQTESDVEKADFRKRFEKARAEKLEIANAKARGELIDRALVTRVFSEIYSIERSIILNVGPAQAGTIAALFGGDAEATLKIQKIIDGDNYAALGAIKAAINSFLRRVETDEIKDGIPEKKPKPAVKKKRIKAAG
jgi:hypothetical protein